MSGAQHGYVDPSSTDRGTADETDEVDLEVLCLTGEGVRLSIPCSTLGYDLRRLVSEKLPCKPGAKLAMHHVNAKLMLNQTLGEQGTCWKIGNAVLHIHTNQSLYTAWSYVCGLPTSARESFVLEGVTRLEGATCLGSIYIISPPGSLANLDLWWPEFQSKPGFGDLAIESSNLDVLVLTSTKAWSG